MDFYRKRLLLDWIGFKEWFKENWFQILTVIIFWVFLVYAYQEGKRDYFETIKATEEACNSMNAKAGFKKYTTFLGQEQYKVICL